MSVRDNEDNQNLVKSVDLSQTMKSRGRSYQPKCHPIHWILPLFAYAYVPLLFILGPLMDDDGFDRYYLFVYSGVLLLFLIPGYLIALVWLTRRRLKQGNNTPALTLFQILALFPLLSWLFLVLTFNGSPA